MLHCFKHDESDMNYVCVPQHASFRHGVHSIDSLLTSTGKIVQSTAYERVQERLELWYRFRSLTIFF